MQTRRIVIAGLSLGAFVTAWALFMGVTGWAFDPALAPIFGLVIVFQIGMLIVLLRSTAAENGFVAQLKTGTLASLVATPIVFLQSLLFSIVLFPTPSAHPLPDAMAGVMGTLGTGVVVSAIAGAFLRK